MKMFAHYLILVLLCLLTPSNTTSALSSDSTPGPQLQCPGTSPQLHHDSVLAGGKTAGVYNKKDEAEELSGCVKACCDDAQCHVALLHDHICLTVVCGSEELCRPKPGNGTTLVMVRPVGQDQQAEWVAPASTNKTHMENGRANAISEHLNQSPERPPNSTATVDRRCEFGMRECGINEVCQPLGNRNKNGLCMCLPGYSRETKTNNCVLGKTATASETKEVEPTIASDTGEGTSSSSISPAATDAPTAPSITSEKPVEKLVVSISNKTIYLLPNTSFYEDKITLSAYAIGSAIDDKYEWTVLQQPDSVDTGSVSDPNSQTITLSHLSQGLYLFKVVVDATGAHGEAVGNVTVKPAKRINQPPKAIIVPPSQQIKLPTATVIVDGSSSTDDDGIASYRWELITAPLGYKLGDQTGPTLQLTDLVPGNYTIMLHVKDKEGLEGNVTTVVTIIKETDYPPTANAGGDVIVYLPQTEVTLSGNASSDDHGIQEWEWTKGPKDSGRAVDMQDTRTPFLHLSNLEEGHYQFTLRVTDSLGQSSNTSVYVYVQKPNLTVPKANAGEAVKLVLPNTTVVLDGSHSTDLAPTTHWLWTQHSGPNAAKLSKKSEMKVNVTGLTKGQYIFGLTLWNGDDQLKNTTANVTVTVIQAQNVAPEANAGGDFSLTLPQPEVIVNGSKSTDDVAVTKWLWERDASSLAAGTVLGDSDHTPILRFTDVIAGRYVWKLTVWDDQGASSSDTVSIIVKQNAHHLDEVEVVFGMDRGSLSYGQLSTLLQKLELLLHSAESSVKLNLLTLAGLPQSGRVSLTFLAVSGEEVVHGTEIVSLLRHQIMSESSELLDVPLLSVHTVICQNNCSGHGECVQATRECHCHSWWMESFFRRHMGDGLQNCDWSVVYVFVSICMSVVGVGVVVWGLGSLLARRLCSRSRPRRKPLRYTLLNAHDDPLKNEASQLYGQKCKPRQYPA